MYVNLPTDGHDAFGQLGLTLDSTDTTLDSFLTKGYIHGYSTYRKLISTATNAYEARRETDDATQDIGFSGSLVNVNGLLSFAGSTDTRIQVWYDQVGSSDATAAINSTSQYRLANSGVAETIDGTIASATSVDSTQIPYPIPSTVTLTNFTVFAVLRINSLDSGFFGSIKSTDNTDYVAVFGDINLLGISISGTLDSIGNAFDADIVYSYCIVRNGTTANYWVNNVSLGSDLVDAADFLFEAVFRAVGAGYHATEIHVFDNALSETDRNAFNEDLDQFHGI